MRFNDFKVNYSILIVEDNLADARLIEEYLSDFMIVNSYFSYELHHVSTLRDAIDLADEVELNVVLLDLSLSDSSGLETFEHFHQLNPDLPIIILSGYDRKEVEIQAVQQGAQDYLVKGEVDGNLLFRSMQYAIERQRLLMELHALSLRDELTGLYNRRGFMTLAQEHIKIARRNKQPIVLLYIDLDNMKHINDKLGHSYGDMALVETANILTATFRDSDVVARMGGDEFAALAVACEDGSDSMRRRLAENLIKLNANPDREFQLKFSVGISEFDPENPINLQQMIDEADDQMYENKRQNKRPRSTRQENHRRAA